MLSIIYAGIPGCAKSALCKEILSSQEGLGDDRPVHSLMGDLIKGLLCIQLSISASYRSLQDTKIFVSL